MITFNFLGKYGRMGNQMFQYAALYSIAKTRDYRFGIPYSVKNENPYLNMCLNECFPNLTAEDSSKLVNIRRMMVEKFEYDNTVFGLPDNIDIVGYFQSEKYFKHYRNDLLKEFAFKEEINSKANDIRSKITDPVISIHLRLGDYKNLVGKHPICTKEYYSEALDLLPKDLMVIAFSDEPNIAKELFDNLNRKYILSDNNQYIDMCLMNKCDYHVIANSSYSWWGSWLASSNKTIAPKNWFGDSPEMPKNWSDIYCKDWIVI